jgi:hypothetical protein
VDRFCSRIGLDDACHLDAAAHYLRPFDPREVIEIALTIIWKDGTRMQFDGGRTAKPFAALFDNPSIRDMFYAPYPLGKAGVPPDAETDPGRVRYEAFFTKMYGDCRKGDAAKTLTDVVWLPKKWGKPVRVTRVNGVAD